VRARAERLSASAHAERATIDAVAGDELVAVYDADGHEVGSATRARMRAEGLWHAATMVLVRSGDLRRVYVHRRSPDKDVFPGLRDCWAGGVLGAREAPDVGARRELAEELGITGVTPTPLFVYRFERGSVRCHNFAYETTWDGPVVHQAEEIVSGGWMELAELTSQLRDPATDFVPDGRAVAMEWLRRQSG
jgi:8-oxo-dGTP pyrophosphatase MutT (NUDIX family)